MFKILTLDDNATWDRIVLSFSKHDVYYLSGYVKAFQIHGDGEPQLLFYEKDGLKAIYVYMKRKTAIEGVYDSITPYGYGGVLFEGDVSPEKLHVFWKAYVKKMQELNIIDNFVRYHPVLANAIPMKEISTAIDLGKTIALDLSSPDVIWENIVGKTEIRFVKLKKMALRFIMLMITICLRILSAFIMQQWIKITLMSIIILKRNSINRFMRICLIIMRCFMLSMRGKLSLYRSFCLLISRCTIICQAQ